MEPIKGIHLGLVVSSSPDPEGRNRVQVWVPHLSNTLYGPLNQKLKDVKFKGPEDLNTIDKDILITLQTTLPWAEYGAPLFGGSSGAFNTATGQTAVNSGSTFQGSGNAAPFLPTASANMKTDGTKPATPSAGVITASRTQPTLTQRGISFASGIINLALPDGTTKQYPFNNGGGGAGAIPAGNYTISNPQIRNTPGMVVDGVGYSFNLSDIYDPAAGRNRTELRIHPDGGATGTAGCIGIVGDGNTQSQFYKDLNSVLAANGGVYNLNIVNDLPGDGTGKINDPDPTKPSVSTGSTSGAKGVVYPDRSAAVGCVPSNVGTPGSPVGTFSTPNGGTKVWVFFMGGDAQRPVYFAQSPNPGDVNALRG